MINKKDIQLIIPMSGTGNRFIEAGYADPKPLIEVDGKPIIAHVLDMFPGVEDVTFICNADHLDNTNMRKVLDQYCPTCKIVSIPPHKKGPVYAVSQISSLLDQDKPVIVSYCDFGTVWDFDGFLEAVDGFAGGIPCYTGFHPHMLGGDNYAFCKTDEDMILQDIQEKKPFTDNKMGEYASNGAYYFASGTIVKEFFRELMYEDINLNGEFYVSLVYKLLLREGLDTVIFEIDKMLQWGTPYDLEIYKGWSDCFKNLKKEQDTAPEQDFTLILPMAGKGERFSSRGYDKPKPLIPVDGDPMIIRAVKSLPKFKNSYFICLDKHVQEHIIDKEILKYYPNASVLPIEGVTEGQACTCYLAAKELGGDTPILISACDNGACYDEAKFLELVNDETVDVIVWSFRNNQTSKVNPDMYAWLDVDEDDNVRGVSCKKFPGGDPLTTHAIIGTFYYRRVADFKSGLTANYDRDIRTNGEFYVDDILNRNIEAGLNVKVFEVDNYIGWGTPDDYETYNYWREYFGS